MGSSATEQRTGVSQVFIAQAVVLWKMEEKSVLYLEGLATRWHQGVSTGSLFLYLREEGASLTLVSEGQEPAIVLCLR